MRELKLVRSATGWLRRLGALLLISLFSYSLATFIAGSANANPGTNSEIDSSVVFNATGNLDQIAELPASTFPEVSGTGTWEMWLRPLANPRSENHFLGHR